MFSTYMEHKRERVKPTGGVTARYLLYARCMCAVILQVNLPVQGPLFLATGAQ